MAVHKPLWGPVENQMMTEIFEPEVLRREVPGIADVLDGAALMRSMHEEIGVLGRYKKAAGFTNDRSFQLTSKINTAVQVMVEEFHEAGCSCRKGVWGATGHKAWYYYWLAGPGKDYDVRGKIIL